MLMRTHLLSRRDIDFLLHEWIQVEHLTSRARFSDHSRQTFDAALDVYEAMARERFAPHNKRNDQQEPQLDGGRVLVNPEVGDAVRAFCSAGLVAAVHDYAIGGMQLPYVVERTGMAYMFAANISSAAYPFLTMANANLLLCYGTREQREGLAGPMLDGRFFGTMCLSEPQAGSSLADIRTRAEPTGYGSFRLFGNKMWISGGDHELAENIIHLVLAKIPNESGELPLGVHGISLFAVPKYVLNTDGSSGERNDVAVAGLNHKMGYRGTVNCALNFGEGRFTPAERPGAIGTLLGEPGQGLTYMFHMMNEARIGVGLGAAALGYTGYLHALTYARNRVQGRAMNRRGGASSPVPIIQHADVRRMLLAQKAYVEGALALCLYSASLVDDRDTAVDPTARREAGALLDLLTPVSKSWPAQWCVAANDLAIQVHGGYGYSRDYNVEQFYRDNRLNPIHEGTFGIQALDLLGRKVCADSGAALDYLVARIAPDVASAQLSPTLRDHGRALHDVWKRVRSVTESLLRIDDSATRLANAAAYLDAFGHAVVAWIWLSQALVAERALANLRTTTDRDFYAGKLQACNYFFRWELPKVAAWLGVLDPIDTTCLEMQDAWF